MKNLLQKLFLISGAALIITSCDKVDRPYEKIASINLDTTLYPNGTWDDYLENEYPVFGTNANVLIEDYTGHTCISCPPAATEAHNIHLNNPSRVFVASIHVDPGALLSFQKAYPDNAKYYTDHTNLDAIAYGKIFESGFGFAGNPQGTVNRKTVLGKMFSFKAAWSTKATEIMNENNLRVNIQSVFNYYQSTNAGYLHVEVEKKTNEAIDMNTVVYVIQDTLVDWQTMPDNTDEEFYVHRDKHLGSIDNNPFGFPTFKTDAANGEKAIIDYSYKLPVGIDKSNMHFLVYVYNTETYEILQVIKQTIE